MAHPYTGLLKLNVKRAQNLKASDLLSNSSDPYVIASLGNQNLKTRAVKRCLDPEWNEQLTFGIPPETPLQLHLVVMDKDKFFKDEILGETTFDLEPLIDVSNKYLMDTMSSFEGKETLKIAPSFTNNLAKESYIWITKGQFIQNALLKLIPYDSEGLIEIEVTWKNI